VVVGGAGPGVGRGAKGLEAARGLHIALQDGRKVGSDMMDEFNFQ
jgi:hypothetical protein